MEREHARGVLEEDAREQCTVHEQGTWMTLEPVQAMVDLHGAAHLSNGKLQTQYIERDPHN